MKVDEILEKYDGKVLKMSFGTGFVFCGKVDDSLKGTLDRADLYYLDMAQRGLQKTIVNREHNKIELKNLPGIIEGQEKLVKQLHDDLDKAKAELDAEPDKIIQGEKREAIKKLKEQIAELEGDKKQEGKINLNKRRIKFLERKIVYQAGYIKNVEKYIDTYTPLIDREVIEEYPSIDYTDIVKIDMIVRCKGQEDGRYWTVKEYQEDTERPY